MISKRRKNFINNLEKKSISILFSGVKKHKSADAFYPFVVNRNYYYLTNLKIENSALLIIKGESEEIFLFAEKNDPVKALWDGPKPEFKDLAIESGIKIENILPIEQLENFLLGVLSTSRRAVYGEINNLYLDLEFASEIDLSSSKYFLNNFKSKVPYLNVKSSSNILSSLRMIKDELEIKNIKKAIDITNEGLKYVLSFLKPNINEKEIEAKFLYKLNILNSSPSFDTIVAGGKRGTILHYVDNNQEILNNELVLLDLGALYNEYAADISRTYPVNGKFSKRQREIYEIVLKANKETIKWAKPGITIAEFNNYGKQILIDECLKIGLIKEPTEISKYYYHSLGHYLGLDVHDVGNYNDVIKEGAVLTVEPGLYIAEEKIGIRIEDDILITKDGNINLSKHIIKEVDEIEKMMKK